ncbi:hypothetical protein D3C71_1041370 [compost metagenome]
MSAGLAQGGGTFHSAGAVRVQTSKEDGRIFHEFLSLCIPDTLPPFAISCDSGHQSA